MVKNTGCHRSDVQPCSPGGSHELVTKIPRHTKNAARFQFLHTAGLFGVGRRHLSLDNGREKRSVPVTEEPAWHGLKILARAAVMRRAGQMHRVSVRQVTKRCATVTGGAAATPGDACLRGTSK